MQSVVTKSAEAVGKSGKPFLKIHTTWYVNEVMRLGTRSASPGAECPRSPATTKKVVVIKIIPSEITHVRRQTIGTTAVAAKGNGYM